MVADLRIEADWETLPRGTPEDRACFAAIGIWLGDLCLSEAQDDFVGRTREKIHLSAYRLAEWLAWNWWRLRWEPDRTGGDWASSHHLPSIGGGYIWPNIEIVSDGECVELVSRSTRRVPREPIRYISWARGSVPATRFEGALDAFIEKVVGQLHQSGLGATNLNRIWTDVCDERRDPDVAPRRKLEARLGFDPDEGPEALLERLIRDGAELGDESISELAADNARGMEPPGASDLRQIAASQGFDMQPLDAARLTVDGGTLEGNEPPWRRGQQAAQAVRMQLQIGADPLSDDRLAQIAGIRSASLSADKINASLSFALGDGGRDYRIVFRSRWKTGRRFEAARLLGDLLGFGGSLRLRPATGAATARQKWQRAFAAELLSPFEVVRSMLGADLSVEKRRDIAEYFDVSEMTIRTQLVNHRVLDRGALDDATVRAA